MLPDPILAYHQNSFHQSRFIDILNQYDWKGNESILDIGCGDGKITVELAKRVPNGSVLGIDISDNAVQFAKNKFPKNQHSNLDFCHLDFMNSDYTEKFDLIVSVGAIHYIPDQYQALKRVKDSLKPDGEMLLYLVGLGSDPIWQAMTILLSTPKWQHLKEVMSYGLCSEDQYLSLFHEVGLNIIEFRAEEISEYRRNKQEIKQGFLGNFLSITNRVPQSECDEFLDDFIQLILLYFVPDQDQNIKVWQTFLYCRAIKSSPSI